MVGMCTPGRTRTYSVACAAVRVKRGSMTIMLPRLSSLPSRMCCSDTGCASAGLPPMIIGIVGSPEGGELAVEIGGFIGELGGAEPVHRFGTRPRADLHQLVADLIDRLIPGDSVPPAVHQFHRIAQPTVAVHIVANGCTFAAVRATIDR